MKDTHLHEEHENTQDEMREWRGNIINNKSNKYNRLYQVISECGGKPSQEHLDEIVRIVVIDFLKNNPNIY